MILRSVRVNTQIVTGQSRGGLLEFHLRDEDDQKRLEEAYAAFMKIYQTTPRTLCHDDLLPFNLLIGERAVLIDWEYGGLLPYPASFARLIAHCYWLLRKQGIGKRDATAQLEGQSTAYKNELLFQNGINFDNLPAWQKRGIGLYWVNEEKQGFNPVTGQTTAAIRRRLKTDSELPLREEYADFISTVLQDSK